VFFEKFRNCRGFLDAKLILDVDPEFPHSFDINRFTVVFLAVNGKQQIGNEASHDLYHQTVAASSCVPAL
jgi:hypothetical protein